MHGHCAEAPVPIVLKLLGNPLGRAEEAGRGDATLSRTFSTEYDFVMALPNHPGIVKVFHYYTGLTAPYAAYLPLLLGEEAGVAFDPRTVFVAMARYSASFRTFLEKKRGAGASAPPRGAPAGQPLAHGLPEREWRLMFLCVAEAAAFLRSHYVCHRDLKDDNFFMSADGRPVIADFGTAMWLRDKPTAFGSVEWAPRPFNARAYRHEGNPAAMAPEVARAMLFGAAPGATYEEIFGKNDVFGMGRMMFTVLQSGAGFPIVSRGAPHYEDTQVRYGAPLICQTCFVAVLSSFCLLKHHRPFHVHHQIPELPEELSHSFRSIVTSCVADDPSSRPTALEAWRRMAFLCFGPPVDDVIAGAGDTEAWLATQRQLLFSGAYKHHDEVSFLVA